MDSSVTEHYLDYDSDQFDTWLKDFDTQQESSDDDVYTDVSVSSVINKRKKKNSIFVKSVPKKKNPPKIESTINNSETVSKPRRRKVPLFFIRGRKTKNVVKNTKTEQVNQPKKPVRRTISRNQKNWDKININDLNLILPKL